MIRIGISVMLIMLSTSIAYSQSEFEGYISYNLSASNVSEGIDEDELMYFMGRSSIFYYKEGSFLQTYSDSQKEFDFLDLSGQKYFHKQLLSDTIFQIDPGKNNRFLIRDWEETENVENILGVNCNLLKIWVYDKAYDLEQSLEFYYGKEAEINGADFKGIKLGYMDFVYGKINAIPLKTIIKTPYYDLSITATNIVRSTDIDLYGLFKEFSKDMVIKKTE